jgi:hypothetical protein
VNLGQQSIYCISDGAATEVDSDGDVPCSETSGVADETKRDLIDWRHESERA